MTPAGADLSVLQALLWNALEASVLALAVFAVSRLARPSAPLRHLLWLLVAVKLLLPPIAVEAPSLSDGCVRGMGALVKLLVEARDAGTAPGDAGERRLAERLAAPAPLEPTVDSPPDVEPPIEADGDGAPSPEASAGPSSSIASVASIGLPAGGDAAAEAPCSAAPVEPRGMQAAAPPSPTPAGARRWPVDIRLAAPAVRALGAAWLLGSTTVLLAHAVLLVLFRSRLRRAAAVRDEGIEEVVRDVAACFGLRRPPPVVVIEGGAPPLVFALGRPVVVVPRDLADALGPQALRNLIAHEVAHIRRRDHWAAWVDLAVRCVFFWLPTAWWALREMRVAADEAADAWAVRVVGSRKSYAESLFEAVRFLSVPGGTPALVRALGERSAVERRLIMVIRGPLRHRNSWPALLGAAVLAIAVLPAAPGRARGQAPTAVAPVPASPASPALPAADDPATIEPVAPVAPIAPAAPPAPPPPAAARAPVPSSAAGGEWPTEEPLEADEPETTPKGGRSTAPRAGAGGVFGLPSPAMGPGGRGPDTESRLVALERKMDKILRELETLRSGPSMGSGSAGGMGGAYDSSPMPKGGKVSRRAAGTASGATIAPTPATPGNGFGGGRAGIYSTGPRPGGGGVAIAGVSPRRSSISSRQYARLTPEKQKLVEELNQKFEARMEDLVRAHEADMKKILDQDEGAADEPSAQPGLAPGASLPPTPIAPPATRAR